MPALPPPAISELLPQRAILWHLDYANKKRAFERVSKEVEDASGVGRDIVFVELMERERLGPTTVAPRIAVPHVRIREIRRPLCILLRLKQGIVYTIGEEKVHTMFFLITPRSAERQASASEQKNHLRLLAMISRMIADSALMAALDDCDSGEAAHDKIVAWERSHSDELRAMTA